MSKDQASPVIDWRSILEKKDNSRERIESATIKWQPIDLRERRVELQAIVDCLDSNLPAEFIRQASVAAGYIAHLDKSPLEAIKIPEVRQFIFQLYFSGSVTNFEKYKNIYPVNPLPTWLGSQFMREYNICKREDYSLNPQEQEELMQLYRDYAQRHGLKQKVFSEQSEFLYTLEITEGDADLSWPQHFKGYLHGGFLLNALRSGHLEDCLKQLKEEGVAPSHMKVEKNSSTPQLTIYFERGKSTLSRIEQVFLDHQINMRGFAQDWKPCNLVIDPNGSIELVFSDRRDISNDMQLHNLFERLPKHSLYDSEQFLLAVLYTCYRYGKRPDNPYLRSFVHVKIEQELLKSLNDSQLEEHRRRATMELNYPALFNYSRRLLPISSF